MTEIQDIVHQPIFEKYNRPLVFIALLLLSSLTLILLALRKYLRANSEYIPGYQCNRLAATFTSLHFIWRHRKNMNLPLGQAFLGTSDIFRKEGLFRLWIFNMPLIAIVNAEMAEAFLNCDASVKAPQYDYLRPWLREGLLLSMGKKWKTRRRLLTPAFHFNILESFISPMNSVGKEFASILKVKSQTEWIDFNPLVSRCTLDILCESIMGIRLKSLNAKECLYTHHLETLKKAVFIRLTNPLIHFDFLFKLSPFYKKYKESLRFVYEFNTKVIQKRKKNILNNPELYEDVKSQFESNAFKLKKPFLDLLLCHHIFSGDLSEDDIEEEVSTFMFEGHDTTALGLTCTLFFMANYPDVQRKVHEELDSIFGDDKERDVTFEDLKQMEYLGMVIKESLRMMPSVPLIGRISNEDSKLGDFHFSKGTTFGILIGALHYDPKYFENPLLFNPDNFLPEKCAKRHPYAYIPFSAGPRNCIGQRFAQLEMKTLIALLLRNLKVKSFYHHYDVHLKAEIILEPEPAITLKFFERGSL